jgi:hypothetical protein
MSGPQPRHVWASAFFQQLSPRPDIFGPLSGFQKRFPDMLAPSPDMSDLSALSQVKSQEPDLSDSDARF